MFQLYLILFSLMAGPNTLENQTLRAWETLQASEMTDTDCYAYDQEIKRINQDE